MGFGLAPCAYIIHEKDRQINGRRWLADSPTLALPPQFKFQVCSSFMSGPARSRRETRRMRGEAWPRRKAKAPQRRPRRDELAEREGNGNAGGDSLGPLDFLPSHPPYRNRRETVQDRG